MGAEPLVTIDKLTRKWAAVIGGGVSVHADTERDALVRALRMLRQAVTDVERRIETMDGGLCVCGHLKSEHVSGIFGGCITTQEFCRCKAFHSQAVAHVRRGAEGEGR